jgi:hypothetical protein
MEDADLTDGNLLSDEMKVNLHMLRALMLIGVGGEVIVFKAIRRGKATDPLFTF